eukprot:scaffold10020_cov122-Isochrysis_galbana.AAC.8
MAGYASRVRCGRGEASGAVQASREPASEEVGHVCDGGLGCLLCALHLFEYLEIAPELVVQRQDASVVAATVAVVWRRPNGDKLLVEHVLVPLLHQLVRAADELETVDGVKLLRHLGTEEPASAAR